MTYCTVMTDHNIAGCNIVTSHDNAMCLRVILGDIVDILGHYSNLQDDNRCYDSLVSSLPENTCYVITKE